MQTSRQSHSPAERSGQLPGIPGKNARAGSPQVHLRSRGLRGPEPAGNGAEHRQVAGQVSELSRDSGNVYVPPLVSAAESEREKGRMGRHENADGPHGQADQVEWET